MKIPKSEYANIAALSEQGQSSAQIAEIKAGRMAKTKTGRGSNSRSHHNKPKLGAENKEIGLLPEQWELAKKIGEGNYSKGVRSLIAASVSLNTKTPNELFAKLPLLGRVKLALELLLEGDDKGRELGESVLLELEDLEIENLYAEAFVEGAIQKPKQGAWIVEPVP